MFSRKNINLPQKVFRNRHVDSLCSAFKFGKINIDHYPNSARKIGIFNMILKLTWYWKLLFSIEVTFNSVLNVFYSFFKSVTSGETPRNIGNTAP